MLAVLSDLHFTESRSTKLGNFTFNRNLPVETYQAYFAELNQVAVTNGIQKVDLVLAGDILELSRSGIWLESSLRPYIANSMIKSGSKHEKTIFRIIDAISQEDQVAETLAMLKEIQNYFDVPIELHYLLGNHDRLVNATANIRVKVREIFGLTGGDSHFLHHFLVRSEDGDPFCLIRHGHEYDPMNFALNTHTLDVIPEKIEEKIYGLPCLGDLTTIELGGALPKSFIEEYGESAILKDEILMALYRRLMAFDDVRPTTALLAYLFSTPDVSKKKTWELIRPCLTRVINNLSDNDQVIKIHNLSKALPKRHRLLLRVILDTDLLAQGAPYWMIKQIIKRVSKQIKLKSPVKWVKRESVIKDQNSGCDCVISGHTHFSEVSLISAQKGHERYYLNTGTWRNVIPATRNFRDFGRLKAMTKVIVFKPDENPQPDGEMPWSFYFLSGVSFGHHRYL